MGGGGVVLEVVGVGVGEDVGSELVLPPEPDPVLLVVGVGVADGVLDALGVDVEPDDEGVLDDDGVLGASVAADDEADGVAARAVVVTPLEITNSPVARPSVTGRECEDRMRTPCLCLVSRRGNVLVGKLSHCGGKSFVLITDPPIRHQYRLSPPPRIQGSFSPLPVNPAPLGPSPGQPAEPAGPLWVRRFRFPVRFRVCSPAENNSAQRLRRRPPWDTSRQPPRQVAASPVAASFRIALGGDACRVSRVRSD